MLLLRIDEEVGEDAPHEGLLGSMGCGKAAETERAFLARGTLVDPVSGVAHLLRADADNDKGGRWSKAGGRDGKQQWKEATIPVLATTPLVFLPAVPSNLPLWRLLSPEDALSGKNDGPLPPSPVASPPMDSTPPGSTTTQGGENLDVLAANVKSMAIAGSCTRDSGAVDNGGGCVGDEWKGTGRVSTRNDGGGRGAVRLIQVVAAAQTPYRYAVVFHFWDAADAALFVEKFNGLPLPDRGVLKALFLSAAEMVPSGSKADGEGHEDDVEAFARRRRRRSLSEGVALSASTGREGGSEEFKSNWPGGAGQGKLSCSPPRDRGRGGVAVGRANGVFIDSLSPPRPPDAVEQSGGKWMRGGGGTQERKGHESPGSLSPQSPWRESSETVRAARTTRDRRQRQRAAFGWRDGTGVGDGGNSGGGYGGGGTELPPCPVCLDRLDPTVSGVPSARTRICRSRPRWCDGGGVERYEGWEKAVQEIGGAGDGVQAASESTAGDSGGRGPLREGGGRAEDFGGGCEETVQGRGQGGTALNLAMWKGSDCRVCRSLTVGVEGASDVLRCETCRIAHNLWICVVCGHIGCGRYTEEHANRHFSLSRHTYSLQLSTGRVWDYIGDTYAHRAFRGHVSPSQGGVHRRLREGRHGYGLLGAPVGELGAAEGAGRDRDSSPPLGSNAVFDERGEADSVKVAVVLREFEALVVRQLQEQRRYFEGLIATAVAAEAEANAPAEEGLSDEERLAVARLRKEVEVFSEKYDGILDSLRVDEEAARQVRSENRSLVSEKLDQKQAVGLLKKKTLETNRLCELEMAELEGQRQDVLFSLKAQQEVKSNPQREELVGGSVVMGEGSGAAGTSRGGGKETERERLARRLRERHNARRGTGGGGNP